MELAREGKPASQLVQGHKEELIGFLLQILGLQTHPSTWPLGFGGPSQRLCQKQRLYLRRAVRAASIHDSKRIGTGGDSSQLDWVAGGSGAISGSLRRPTCSFARYARSPVAPIIGFEKGSRQPGASL